MFYNVRTLFPYGIEFVEKLAAFGPVLFKIDEGNNCHRYHYIKDPVVVV